MPHQVSLDGPPPAPPMGGGPGAPSYPGLVGPTDPSGGAGVAQIGGAAVRMAMEIDQAIKLLAQAVPVLAPWAARVTTELRIQLGQALASGGVPTSPEPSDNSAFPDGSGRL